MNSRQNFESKCVANKNSEVENILPLQKQVTPGHTNNIKGEKFNFICIMGRVSHSWIFLQHIRFPSTFNLHSKGQFPSTFYYINVEKWRFPTTVNNNFICKFIHVWSVIFPS